MKNRVKRDTLLAHLPPSGGTLKAFTSHALQLLTATHGRDRRGLASSPNTLPTSPGRRTEHCTIHPSANSGSKQRRTGSKTAPPLVVGRACSLDCCGMAKEGSLHSFKIIFAVFGKEHNILKWLIIVVNKDKKLTL